MSNEPTCPICNYQWDHWMVCDHPGCHDGRLPKPIMKETNANYKDNSPPTNME